MKVYYRHVSVVKKENYGNRGVLVIPHTFRKEPHHWIQFSIILPYFSGVGFAMNTISVF